MFDVCRNDIGKPGLFAEARKRSARGKAIEVVDVEPLAIIDSKEKVGVPPLKQKMDFGMHMEGKLMSDAMKIIRTSRRLAGIKPPTQRRSSSARGKQGAQEMREEEKGKVGREVYTPCWNVKKNNRLTSVDERKEWAENILPLRAKTKVEIYPGKELGGRIDHAIYEVLYYT